MFQTLQPFLIALAVVAFFALLYFPGKIERVKKLKQGIKTRPIGAFYATMLMLPLTILRSLVAFLKPFDAREKTPRAFLSLRDIVVIGAACFAVIVVSADGYNTLQALSALWDIGFSMPDIPFLSYSMGWLFLALSGVTGFICLELLDVVEVDARIFHVTKENKKTFQWLVFLTFLLSLLASIAFNALKPLYIADSESAITFALRVAVFVITGTLLPLTMALCVYIIALALHVVVSLSLCVVCFGASTLASLLDFLVLTFHEELPEQEKGMVSGKREDVVITQSDDTPTALPTSPSALLLLPDHEGEMPPLPEPATSEDAQKEETPEKKEKFHVKRSLEIHLSKRLIPLSAGAPHDNDTTSVEPDNLPTDLSHNDDQTVKEEKPRKRKASPRKVKQVKVPAASRRGRSKKIAAK